MTRPRGRRRNGASGYDRLPQATLVFNAVFLLLAVGSGASPPPTLIEARGGTRLVVLVAAFVGAAIVTPRLLAWVRRQPAWRAGTAGLSAAVCGCAVVVLSSLVEVESSDWVPSPRGPRPRTRSRRGGDRASWTPAGCGWRRQR